MRLSPKKKRKGGKKREEAGPALGALGSRESCLLSLSWTHNSELRTSRSCRSRPSFTPIRSRPRKLLPGKVRGGGRVCAEAGLTPGVLGGRAGSPLYHSSLGRLVFLYVASPLKPPILSYSSRSRPWRLSPKKMGEDGEAFEEEGPTPSALGVRGRCLPPPAFMYELNVRPSRSRGSRLCLSLRAVGP